MSTATQSIREIVTKQPSAARIFHRFDIDLCVQADLSLEGACREFNSLSIKSSKNLLTLRPKNLAVWTFDPATVSLGRLIQHIVRVHHHRVRQELPARLRWHRKSRQSAVIEIPS